jgi:two-component system NtrC family response regulator
MRWFLQQPFPGNVRELKNTLESVIAIAQQGVVTLADIQLLHLDAGFDAQGSSSATSSNSAASNKNAAARFTADLAGSLDEQVRQLEISLLTQALLESQGNRSQAARALGLSRQGLLKKIERYGLQQMGVAD